MKVGEVQPDLTERDVAGANTCSLFLNSRIMKGLLPGLVGSAHTLWLLSPVFAQPASLVFQDCFSDSNATQKLQISTVYAQVLDGGRLDLTVLGTAPVQIVRASNTTDNPVASEFVFG